MAFLKEFFKKVDFEKNQQTTKKHAKLPSRQRVNISTGSKTKTIRESPPQFENPIMAQVYVRSIMHSTMYQKAPFCSPEMVQ